MNHKQIANQLVRAGMTPAEIGNHVGATTDMVRRWIRGENKPTGARKAGLEKLAKKVLENYATA